MDANAVQQRLIDAETKLSRALQRLHALRRAALYGNYDPVEFDRAVMSYREAEADVQQAREAWATLNQGAPSTELVTAAPEKEPEPFVVTPRLEFVKWLVETGRLTDWPKGSDEADVPEKIAA